jgi:hypothetical protein
MDNGDLFEEFDITQLVPLIVLGAAQEAQESQRSNIPRRTEPGRTFGADYLRELLTCGNEKRIYSVLRMKKETFEKLCI